MQQLEADENRLFKGEKIDLDAMLQKLGTVRAQLSDAQAHLEKVSELDGQCPTCEQDIDWDKMEELRMSYVRSITSGVDQEEDIEEKLERARDNNLRVGRRDSLQNDFENLIRNVDNSLPTEIFDGEKLSSKIDEITSKIQNVRMEIEKIAESNMQAERHNTRLDIISEQTNNFENELEEIVAALGKVEEKSAHLEILKKAFLAIRKLMSSISSSRINTLFLDEIISVLDDEGKEKLVEILLGEDLNTYLVSHGWTHPLLAKVEVIKEDNISRLE